MGQYTLGANFRLTLPGNNKVPRRKKNRIMKKIAIIGRPNVGKSTLFNRLVGRRIALVHDQPGMTRDRKEAEGKLYDISFKIVDTAGLADPDNSELTKAMFKQTLQAVEQADVLLFVIDAREGCTPYDRDLANILRRSGKPVIALANKCEGHNGNAGLAEAAGLGLGEVIALSAEHGVGMSDLYHAMLPYFADEIEDDAAEEESNSGRPLQLAIVGRPNVGKSTLVNKLIGEDRLLVADMPGVTRDAISLDWSYKDQAIKLIDTAGLRRRSKISASTEKLAVFDTNRAIQFAEVVILVIDATIAFEKQDLGIARTIAGEGRAMVIAINKWDLVENKVAFMKEVENTLATHLAQVRDIPCITITASLGKNLNKLLDAVLDIYRVWNKRIATAQLNRWLEEVTAAHPAPAVNGRRIRLKYMTQIKSRPPTFAVFASQAHELPESYTRYLINHMRKDFDLYGVPIRIYVRGTKNPYTDQ